MYTQQPQQPIMQNNFMRPQQNSQPEFNLEQFRSMVPQLNENLLTQLVAQARSNGISDQDIQKGLELIKKIR